MRRIVLTHVNGTWEGLRLGEDSETVAELGNVVGGLNLVSVRRLNAHEGDGRVERISSESSSSGIDGVEDSVKNKGTITARDGKSSGLKRGQLRKQTYHFGKQGLLATEIIGKHLLLSFRIIILLLPINTLNTLIFILQIPN